MKDLSPLHTMSRSASSFNLFTPQKIHFPEYPFFEKESMYFDRHGDQRRFTLLPLSSVASPRQLRSSLLSREVPLRSERTSCGEFPCLESSNEGPLNTYGALQVGISARTFCCPPSESMPRIFPRRLDMSPSTSPMNSSGTIIPTS